MLPFSIQKLIKQFSKFPTVGPRTAARFVFYLLRLPKQEIENLIKAISDLQESIKICRFCFKSFEGEGEACEICSNPGRDNGLLCVVEKEVDLLSIEKTGKYRGLYFILGSLISHFGEEAAKELPIANLKQRVQQDCREIILAVNPTVEGEATALYLKKILQPLGKKISQLGRGLPIGGELEYADEETLSSALQRRT